MGLGSDYLDYFHYSDGMGYLIFCCHSVATEIYWFSHSYSENDDHPPTGVAGRAGLAGRADLAGRAGRAALAARAGRAGRDIPAIFEPVLQAKTLPFV